MSKYEGTRLGQQELLAEILEVSDGAWFRSFDAARHVTDAAEYDAGAAGAPGDRLRGLAARGGGLVPGAARRAVGDADAGRLDRGRRSPGRAATVTVFGDFHAEGLYSRRRRGRSWRGASSCPLRRTARHGAAGPGGAARTGIGPTAYAEFERVFGPRVLAPVAVAPGARRPRSARGPAGPGLPAAAPAVRRS